MPLLTWKLCLQAQALGHDNPHRARIKGGSVRQSMHFNARITVFQRTNTY